MPKLTKKKFGILPKKTHTIKGEYCSPSKEGYFSCFSKEALHRIVKAWNKLHPKDLIPIIKGDLRSQWNKINKKLNNLCNNEKCWATTIGDKSLINKHFRPLLPSSWVNQPNEWLSTPDIEKVMKQYETKYNDFAFIGPVPMDFDAPDGMGQCIVNELCQLDLQKMIKRGKYRIGIVFNLDYHNESGSHWVAMFISLLPDDPNFGVHYFDSYATKPPREVDILGNRLIEQSKKIDFSSIEKKGVKMSGGNNIPFTYTYNKIRHQYKNSECGVYSMNFIDESLRKQPRRTTSLSDDQVHRLREYFYHPLEMKNGVIQKGGKRKITMGKNRINQQKKNNKKHKKQKKTYKKSQRHNKQDKQ